MLCKHCKKSIPNSAAVCPYCGKNVKPLTGRKTGGGFSLGKFIAMIGSILVLVSAFVPAFTLNFSSIRISFDVGDVRRWVLVIASVLSILALFIHHAELVYPVATIAVGVASADFLRAVRAYFQTAGGIGSLFVTNGFHTMISYFTVSYSPLFMIGFLIMVIASIVIILKITIGSLFSKR